jgi:SAM-dependent methyltransferase
MNEINKKWHEEENAWWDKYSSIMAYQWKLNSRINKVIRKDMENKYHDFLFKEGGTLLDVGCGTGWLAISFAKKGMKAVGVDFSSEQIKEANSNKIELNLENSEFFCADFLNFDIENSKRKYDSIFINAFLHHLPIEELEQVFKIISSVSKKGAKIYLYEPIMFGDEKNGILGSLFIKFYNKFFSLLMNKIPNLFGFWDDKFLKAAELGYNGMSPNEGSIDYEELKHILNNNGLEISSLTPEHYQSISYSILTHSMKKPYRSMYEFFVPLVYQIDKFIFGHLNWKAIPKRRNFILCSLQLKQN